MTSISLPTQDDAVTLSPIPDVIAAVRAGRPVLVLDDAGREDEADLIVAADLIRADTMAMLIREGSGIVCLCIRPDRASALKLRPMVEVNRSRYATAFTQSIEAAHGISTGVSAADRVQTIQCALRSTLEHSEIVSPGHVFQRGAQRGRRDRAARPHRGGGRSRGARGLLAGGRAVRADESGWQHGQGVADRGVRRAARPAVHDGGGLAPAPAGANRQLSQR